MNMQANVGADVLPRLEALKERAKAIRGKTRKNCELYTLLGDCMEMCRAVRERGDLEQIKSQVVHLKSNGARAYFESGADEFLVVGRFVFESEGRSRADAWRFTATLREAHKKDIAPEELADWLLKNGGINALFRRRKAARSTRTRCLHLNQPVTYRNGRNLTLTLKPDGAGFFHVLTSEVSK